MNNYHIDCNSTRCDVLHSMFLRERVNTLWYMSLSALHLLIYSFIHTFEKHLLSSYWVSGSRQTNSQNHQSIGSN